MTSRLCSITRIKCPEHGVKTIEVPWAREGSEFTPLFEKAALMLVREMPVSSAARFMGITDKSLWRIVFHYVREAMGGYRSELCLLGALIVFSSGSAVAPFIYTIF